MAEKAHVLENAENSQDSRKFYTKALWLYTISRIFGMVDRTDPLESAQHSQGERILFWKKIAFFKIIIRGQKSRPCFGFYARISKFTIMQKKKQWIHVRDIEFPRASFFQI